MYFGILKKDLKRKRAMNIILLLFIILASMFVSSSVNNILSVTSALDNYFEMARVPELVVVNMNKSSSEDVDETMKNAGGVTGIETEDIIFLENSGITHDGELLNATMNNQFLQSDKDMSINYFLDDNSVLESVKPGEVYLTGNVFDNTELEIGDNIVIRVDGVSREFTVAGGLKDAVFGSNLMQMVRYVISEEDFNYYIHSENLNKLYGGRIYYTQTADVSRTHSEIVDAGDGFVAEMSRDTLKFSYVYDMIVTGLILVISLILITVAFVVLRFTISFTLSEEIREIGVMKAIGIGDLKIRGLYLVKYSALSAIGAAIGFVLSFPFGEMLMSVSSKSVIINDQNPVFVNIICSLLVVAVILLFCYGCTGKVRKMSPIDAMRSGQTGERFRKKSILSLGRSKLPATPFLALNDIASSPKRYGIITLTFFLCLSLLLMLSTSVITLSGGSLLTCFGVADSDLSLASSNDLLDFMVEGGEEKCEEFLLELENTLEENDMPAECYYETIFNSTVSHGDYQTKIPSYYGTGTTMDMYEYTAGSPPQSCGEVAITRLSAEELHVNIGDTIKVNVCGEEREFIITAFFQSMNNLGSSMRFYSGEDLNFIYAGGAIAAQIKFTDSPDDEEIERRADRIKELYPEISGVYTSAEWVEKNVGVVDALKAVKALAVILTIVLAALITVLMERSFIAKEQGEIALMKAIGTRNGRIYAWHTARFAIVGIIAVIIAEIFAMPLTHLCIDPIFKMMGMELAIDYVVDPFEMYIFFPLAILVTTIVSAFLTSLYTRKIKSSDTANIE